MLFFVQDDEVMPNPSEIAARVFAAHRIREDNGECVLLLLQPYTCIYSTIFTGIVFLEPKKACFLICRLYQLSFTLDHP
jgi:hypothetical protein